MVLNLKGHKVGPKGNKRTLYAPVDIECHLGSDGRYYVIGSLVDSN